MLYLVRHGQASFGADDYDVLSPLGHRQCEALGAWFARRGIVFEAAFTGTLKRQRASLAAIADGGCALPEAAAGPEWNEYDSEALVRALNPGPLAPAASDEDRRRHFRLLREALARWSAGTLAPDGMPPWADWRAGIEGALDRIRQRFSGPVLLVSSGGPISNACAHVLGAPPATAIELNLRLRNSALTEFAFNARGHVLHAFNQLPHLDAHPDWATYA
jgi:broad specificity phosphatase PhoE